MSRILFKNAKVVRSDGAKIQDLLVQDEKILAVGDLKGEEADETLDLNGRLLLPGGIETHTHLQLESMGTVTADDFASGTRAALLGGTTTVLDFATQFHGESLRQGYEHWRRKCDGNCYCDVGFHMAMTEWNEALKNEMAWAVETGMPSFKLYMAYKDSMMVRDDEIYEALEEAKRLGAVIGFHCENGDLIAVRVRELLEEGKSSPYWHAQSRPEQLEAEAIRRLETTAELLEAPHYVVHLSTRAGLEEIRRARQRQIPVIAETCPQYLLLDESRYGSPDSCDYDEAAKVIMSPPLRGRENQAALWQALESGEIQFVGTDHCSFRIRDQKQVGRGNFSKIPNGAPGIQLRMLLLYTYGVAARRLSLERYAVVTAENAARYFGLYPQKGVLQAGSDADLVILDPRPLRTVRHEDLAEAVDYSPYEGFELRGQIERVYLRGRLAAKDGRCIGDKALGSWIPGHRPMTDIR